MPRKRKPARAYRPDGIEPRDAIGSCRWWRAKFERAIAAGELPVVIRRSEIRNHIGFLLAQSNTEWPVTFGGSHAT